MSEEIKRPEAIMTLEREMIALSPAKSRDEMLAVYDKIRWYIATLKEMQAKCEAAMIEWITENRQDIQASDTLRYFVGTDKTTKCTDLPKAIEALMQASSGDFARFCEALSANAIKYGAARNMLAPDVYDSLFVTVEKPDLKEGKPVRKLMKADARFMKAR